MASRQAVPNRQACRATGTALTRMSRTSIVVTTGIGITVTGIDESGVAQSQLGCRAPALFVGLSGTSGCRPTGHGSPFPYLGGRMPTWNPDVASFVLVRESPDETSCYRVVGNLRTWSSPSCSRGR